MNAMAPRAIAPAKMDPSLEPVRALFAAGFESQILAFEGIKMDIRKDRSTVALRELALRVHKIAGVAETLGYNEIGTVSTRLEREIATLAGQDPVSVLARIESDLENLLDLLEAELD